MQRALQRTCRRPSRRGGWRAGGAAGPVAARSKMGAELVARVLLLEARVLWRLQCLPGACMAPNQQGGFLALLCAFWRCYGSARALQAAGYKPPLTPPATDCAAAWRRPCRCATCIADSKDATGVACVTAAKAAPTVSPTPSPKSPSPCRWRLLLQRLQPLLLLQLHPQSTTPSASKRRRQSTSAHLAIRASARYCPRNRCISSTRHPPPALPRLTPPRPATHPPPSPLAQHLPPRTTTNRCPHRPRRPSLSSPPAAPPRPSPPSPAASPPPWWRCWRSWPSCCSGGPRRRRRQQQQQQQRQQLVMMLCVLVPPRSASAGCRTPGRPA